jgi:hypothetical protein
MATPKTQGFMLSALPRSPSVPNNIGLIDVKAIDDGVRRGLATMEMIRRAPQEAVLADEMAATEIARNQAARAVLPSQTQAALSDTPNRSAILAGQAQVAKAGVPLQLGQIEAQQRAIAADAQLEARAQAEYPQFQAELNRIVGPKVDTGDIVKDMSTPAVDVEAELLTLPTKFPWLANPRYAKDRELVLGALKAEQAARTQRELQELRNAAPARSGLAANLKALIDIGADDETIKRVINKQSAMTPEDPAADRTSRENISQQRNAATVQAARTKYDLSKRAGASKAQAAMEAAEAQTSRLDGLVNDAIGKVGFLTTGWGAALANLPESDARSLRETLDTIKANLGFNELNAMRQNSPTGGALGNVTERELTFLQKTVASLDQYLDGDDLKQRLEEVRQAAKESWGRVRRAYEREYGAGAQAAMSADGTPAAQPAWSDADEKRLQELKAKQGIAP